MEANLNTFLNHNNFTTVCERVGTYIDELNKLSLKKVKRLKDLFQFQKVFNEDSVQGVAGLLTIDTGIPVSNDLTNELNQLSLPSSQVKKQTKETVRESIVFKLSVEVNRTVEHEYFVLKKLNSLRKFCPNFVGTLGLLPAYVARSFFEDKEHEDLKNIFEVKSNPVQVNYLLLEYVSDLTFRHVCKFAHKSIVTGTIISVLCALQIAQNKYNFVHYDLHSGNILMRKTEPDAYFAYIINGQCYVYPTYGWYPVIIDMGSSYVKGLEERPTRTSIEHYHRGLQSTTYDPVSDVHHFLLSAVSRLEKTETQSNEFHRHFRLIATRMMHFFRHGQIWRHTGWKQLPVNILYQFNNFVNGVKPEMCKFYKDLQTAVVETLVLGVKLPWQPITQQDFFNIIAFYYPSLVSKVADGSKDPLKVLVKVAIEDLCHFLNLLDNDPLTKSDINVLYALRSLVEHASLIKDTSKTFELPKETILAFKQVTQGMYPTYTFKLDLVRSFRGAAVICKVMRHLLATFNQQNLAKIHEWQEQSEIKKPVDVIPFLMKNTGVRYAFNSTSPIYIWDSDREQHHKVTFQELKIINEHEIYPNILEFVNKSKDI